MGIHGAIKNSILSSCFRVLGVFRSSTESLLLRRMSIRFVFAFVILAAMIGGLISGCATKRAAFTSVTESPQPPASVDTFSKGFSRRPASLHPSRRAPGQRIDFDVAATDELWVISRSSDAVADRAAQPPGSGALMAKLPQGEVPIPRQSNCQRLHQLC
jgi:hypothetical protein